MLKYLLVFFCLFCFSCATQRVNYIEKTKKRPSPQSSKVNTFELYNEGGEYKTRADSKETAIQKKLPVPLLDLNEVKPLIYSIPLPLSAVRLKHSKLLLIRVTLFRPELESMGPINNEESMLARVNTEVGYFKKSVPSIKTVKKKPKTVYRKITNAKPRNIAKETDIQEGGGITRDKKEVPAIPYKNIFSRPKDSIIITFKGLGWVYDGLEGKAGSSKGIDYKGKDYRNNKTSFNFKTNKRGTYLLKFVKQDNSAASNIKKKVKVNVVKEEDFFKILNTEYKSEQAGNANINTDYTVPDNLYKRGNFKDALNEYLKRYNEDDPYLNNQIALIYLEDKSYQAALKYWRHNLEPSNRYYREALAGTILCAAKLDDIAIISRVIENYKSNATQFSSADEEKYLFETAQALYKNGRTKFAVELLNTYIKRYLNGKYADAVYYYLGNLYENDREIRDLKKSLAFYKKVYNEYTGSAYYSSAYSRIEYIKRHFFDIR